MNHKAIQKFTKEQEEIIEKTFDQVFNNSQRAKFLIDLVKGSLIDIHGEFNPKVSANHVGEILSLIRELLEPVDDLIAELSSNGGYLLWESNLKKINSK